VDQATGDVTTNDRAAVVSGGPVDNRLGELRATMWPRVFTATQVLIEHRLDISSRNDEEMVEALFPYGP